MFFFSKLGCLQLKSMKYCDISVRNMVKTFYMVIYIFSLSQGFCTGKVEITQISIKLLHEMHLQKADTEKIKKIVSTVISSF